MLWKSNKQNHIYFIYMYKEDLALNNQQFLMLWKSTIPNPIYFIYMYKEDLALNNQQFLICYESQPNEILYI